MDLYCHLLQLMNTIRRLNRMHSNVNGRKRYESMWSCANESVRSHMDSCLKHLAETERRILYIKITCGK